MHKLLKGHSFDFSLLIHLGFSICLCFIALSLFLSQLQLLWAYLWWESHTFSSLTLFCPVEKT